MQRRLLISTLALAAAAAPAAALAAQGPRPKGVEVLTTHLANAERFSGTITPGQRLALRRDRSRAFDPAAVAVETAGGERLGYVPPVQAGVLSRLLDHGASGFAEMTPQGQLRVFLDA